MLGVLLLNTCYITYLSSTRTDCTAHQLQVEVAILPEKESIPPCLDDRVETPSQEGTKFQRATPCKKRQIEPRFEAWYCWPDDERHQKSPHKNQDAAQKVSPELAFFC